MSTNPSPYWLRFVPVTYRSKLTNNQSALKIIQNISWLLLDKVIRLTLGLLIGSWVARYLGPSQYGELAYVLAYISFFQAISLLGLDGIVVRDLARHTESAGNILGSAFTLRLTAGFICWLCAVGGMAWSNGWADPSVTLTMLAGGSIVFQAADTIDLWFQSQSQSRRTVVVKLGAYLLSNGTKVILILSQASLTAFAAVMVLDTLVAATGLIIAYRRFPCQQIWGKTSELCRKLLSESWPFMLSHLSIIAYMRIDQLMIKEILGEKELGIYAAILPISTLWYFIPLTLSTSLAPVVAKKKAQDEQAYLLLLAKIFRSFALLGWLTCLPIFFLSELVVDLLFGAAYRSGSSALSIHIMTNLFVNMSVAQGLWLLNEGKAKLSLYKSITGAFICVLGNFILIPPFGITGAAIVAVLSQLFATTLVNIVLAPKIFNMQLYSLLLIKPKHP